MLIMTLMVIYERDEELEKEKEMENLIMLHKR